jgi:hypothetical protein
VSTTSSQRAALAVSCFVGARAMSRRNVPWLARFSLVSGLAIVLGFFAPMFSSLPVGTLGIWFSVVVGWTWLAVLSLHLYRVAPDPNCAPRSG